jgi:hypothetical protein
VSDWLVITGVITLAFDVMTVGLAKIHSPPGCGCGDGWMHMGERCFSRSKIIISNLVPILL